VKKIGLPVTSVFLFTNPGENPTSIPHGLKKWTDIWTSPEDAKAWKWHHITTVEEAKRTAAIINYSSGYASSQRTKLTYQDL
jgi:hypothetical protein